MVARPKIRYMYEPIQIISFKIACVPNEDSDQPANFESESSLSAWKRFGQSVEFMRRLWLDYADVRASFSRCWAHMKYCRKYCTQARREVPRTNDNNWTQPFKDTWAQLFRTDDVVS